MKTLSLFLASLFASSAFAGGFNGSISYTDKERAQHAAGIQTVMSAASECLQADLEHHRKFYAQFGVSPYYGSASAFSKLSPAARREELRKLGVNPALADEMQPTSCIGLAMKCLEKGFTAAGQTNLWPRLRNFADANDMDGTALQAGLRELGWKVLYWNPDVTKNKDWDAKEKANDYFNKKRFWGYHEYRWSTVQNSRTYMYNKVDDITTLVNFGMNPPAKFKDIPFFIGTAHTGYHVFPGAFGKVIEGHSTRAITDSQTVESSDFNPLANGGGPRGAYKSGLMAIPPGYLQ
ncbi:hypothetical protein [Bdellovibrio sp. NC01]|uniref:hypothetical protein n=1 Tax=Bdellovibrio sp. NC01 TaxID=2220073 RepID=UPI001156D2A9|nr:hypothetical protein [Bdellovibrio sp. NC01]QDK38317.1 hypothetical protein DOE51_12380 [Bdellovibrio sp. NC01]